MSSSGPSPRKMKRVTSESDGSDNKNQKFDEETQKTVKEIESCQNEIHALDEEASEEVRKVEQKYDKLQQTVIDKRNCIIAKVPNFWLIAMVNHPQISLLIDEDEEDCFNYLTKLEVDDSDDIKSVYRVKFYFDENPFFENDVLVKEFHLGSVDPKTTSSEIRWKQSDEGRKRELEQKDFFCWLNDHSDLSADDIAEAIMDDLYPNPLPYYLGVDTEEDNGVEEDETEESEDGDAVVVVEEDKQDAEEDEDDKTAAPTRDAEGAKDDVGKEEEGDAEGAKDDVGKEEEEDAEGAKDDVEKGEEDAEGAEDDVGEAEEEAKDEQ